MNWICARISGWLINREEDHRSIIQWLSNCNSTGQQQLQQQLRQQRFYSVRRPIIGEWRSCVLQLPPETQQPNSNSNNNLKGSWMEDNNSCAGSKTTIGFYLLNGHWQRHLMRVGLADSTGAALKLPVEYDSAAGTALKAPVANDLLDRIQILCHSKEWKKNSIALELLWNCQQNIPCFLK